MIKSIPRKIIPNPTNLQLKQTLDNWYKEQSSNNDHIFTKKNVEDFCSRIQKFPFYILLRGGHKFPQALEEIKVPTEKIVSFIKEKNKNLF